MFHHHNIKLAIRSLWKNRTVSIINVAGLSLGIASCLLIVVFVHNELSFDRYNKKADDIVRVVFNGDMQGGRIREANVMPPVAQALKANFPEVVDATRLRANGVPRLTVGDRVFREDAIAFVDSNFFQVFTLPLIRGNAATALLQPNNVIISSSAARKYFGDADPLGQMLVFKDAKSTMKVTGVCADVPENSHFHFDLFASMATLPDAHDESWMRSDFYTYLVLAKGCDPKALEKKLPAVVNQYLAPQFQQAMGISLADYHRKGNDIFLSLQPLTSIHMSSGFAGEMEPHGDMRYIYIFSVVAVFMLLIACINFMNLSTAGASQRAKEIGIRKVLGSNRTALIRQFLAESLLLTSVALVIALGLVYWSLPFINRLAGHNLTVRLHDHLWIIPALLLFGLFTGTLAGSYPAFFLSAFKPIKMLKAGFTNGKKAIHLRSGLVVFQFFVSISLIIGTSVVYAQLSFIRHKELGYDKEQVLVVQDTYWLGDNFRAFRQQLLNDPRVISASQSNYLPAGPSNGNSFFLYPDGRSDQIIKTLDYEVDYDYLNTLGIQLSRGRNFSLDYGSDSLAILVNEAAVRAFGWQDNPEKHTLTHSDNTGRRVTYHVIGVIKDFHFRSLHEIITPLVMSLGSNAGTLLVKVHPADLSPLLASMKKTWDAFRPDAPFSYSFLDDRFNNMYRSEQNIATILAVFAGLTIFVACLGLFGLATFTAAQRTREIGIRKVLGASVTGLVSLLSRDFLKLVLIAFVFAAPAAWLAMNRWLGDFAYRIQMHWWFFAIAIVVVLIIALVTVGFRALGAALANPVDSLRQE